MLMGRFALRQNARSVKLSPYLRAGYGHIGRDGTPLGRRGKQGCLPLQSLALLVVVVGADAAGGDGFVDDILGQVMGQGIVMRKLHMVRAACLGHRIKLRLIV
jgi:hypothetical protein